ncbi:MAG TPA: hypothetical protein VFA66_03845 [Gaiellaceae bacterium]|nr:hypothetical protein [Gaiellaceae bacterium]
MADASEVVKGWIGELAAAGCRYVQIDAPELAEAFADERVRAEHAARGIDPDRFLHEGTELIGEVAQVGVPDGILALHVCKGNGTQSWIAEGGYEEFARHVFARAGGFDVFLLEYDDERSGSFEPLRELPDDKIAVLGLVSTKWTALEEPDELVRRIDDAARIHPKERLALSTQCGFASAAETAEQRKISEGTQEQKLRLVAEIAARVWTHA